MPGASSVSICSVDGKEIKDENVFFQLYQKPNSSILGYRLRLNLFNLSKLNADSTYAYWLNKKPNRKANLSKLLSQKQVDRLGKSFIVSGWSDFLIKTGEAPVIYDSTFTKKSLKRLEAYYYNKGFFDVKANYTSDTTQKKKTNIKYQIALKKPYLIDSVSTQIETPALDSLYKTKVANSLIQRNKQYATVNLEEERNRLTTEFRNNGAYLFQQNYISYALDTINTSKKVNVKLIVKGKPSGVYSLSEITNDNITILNGNPSMDLFKMADVVVGFNTTALVESIASKKPTISTNFFSEKDELKLKNILFDWEGLVDIVRDADQLFFKLDYYLFACDQIQINENKRTEILNKYLGNSDGDAGSRIRVFINSFINNS